MVEKTCPDFEIFKIVLTENNLKYFLLKNIIKYFLKK